MKVNLFCKYKIFILLTLFSASIPKSSFADFREEFKTFLFKTEKKYREGLSELEKARLKSSVLSKASEKGFIFFKKKETIEMRDYFNIDNYRVPLRRKSSEGDSQKKGDCDPPAFPVSPQLSGLKGQIDEISKATKTVILTATGRSLILADQIKKGAFIDEDKRVWFQPALTPNGAILKMTLRAGKELCEKEGARLPEASELKKLAVDYLGVEDDTVLIRKLPGYNRATHPRTGEKVHVVEHLDEAWFWSATPYSKGLDQVFGLIGSTGKVVPISLHDSTKPDKPEFKRGVICVAP